MAVQTLQTADSGIQRHMGVAATATACSILLAWAALPDVRDTVSQRGCDSLLWLALAATVFNPVTLLPRQMKYAAVPALACVWLATTSALSAGVDPSLLIEWSWRGMVSRYSLFQISVLGSALVHLALTIVLNIYPVIVQNVAHLQEYKIQQDKAPASFGQWWHVFVHIAGSQLLIQLPLITGQYFFLVYFQIPFDYDSMPGLWSLAWRVALSLIVDDTWVYFGHRALHDKRIYKYIHKVHHTYTSPFAPDAEYEHPVETVVLGTGFFLACILFTNHLAFMWAFLYFRLVVTYDSHSGYDLPCNILHLIPFYCGAREHDWHHQCFNGNYAPTFVWWDRIFGTDAGFKKHELQRAERIAANVANSKKE